MARRPGPLGQSSGARRLRPRPDVDSATWTHVHVLPSRTQTQPSNARSNVGRRRFFAPPTPGNHLGRAASVVPRDDAEPEIVAAVDAVSDLRAGQGGALCALAEDDATQEDG